MLISYPPISARSLGIFLMILGLITSTGLAQSEQFILEKVTVENARKFSSSIILAESLLETGQSYSKEQLDDAVNRVARLPFILGAEYSLKKNSEENFYELILIVRETKTWFVGAEELFTEGDTLRRSARFRPRGREIIPLNEDDRAKYAGYRLGVGEHGVLWGALDPTNSGRIFLNHTQYDLWGQGVRLQAQYELDPIDKDGADSLSGSEQNQSLRLDLNIPLQGNHALTLDFFHSQDRFQFAREILGSSRDRNVDQTAFDVAWVLNSLDDEVFPTTGRRYRAGAGFVQRDEKRRETINTIEGPETYRNQVNKDTVRFDLGAVDYWPFAGGQSLLLALDVTFQQGDWGFSGEHPPFVDINPNPILEDEAWEGQVTVGYALFLFQDTESPHWRQLRWETEAGLSYGEYHPRDPFSAYPREGTHLRTALKFRSSWGVIKASLTYFEREYDF